jgi:hypothetical protein
MPCRSGCRTRDHATYAACLAAANVTSWNSTVSVDSLYAREVVNHAEITEYKAARAQGIQPAGSKLNEIRAAVDISRVADTAMTIR